MPFNKTMLTGSHQLEEGVEWVACVSCGSREAEPVVTTPNRDPKANQNVDYQVVRCRQCGLHYQNPRPSTDRLDEFYPEHYYAYQPILPKHDRGLKAVGRRLKTWSDRGLRRAFWSYPAPGGNPQRWLLRLLLWPLWLRMRLLAKDIKIVPYVGQGRFLDVGCGTGQFLVYQRQFGLMVAGVERSRASAQFVREQLGIDARAGTLEEVRFPARSFDVIHMSHVFEHLPNPGATLDEMHRILDTGGLILLKVPNITSASAKRFGPYWLGLDLPRHFYHFDPRTITRLLEQHGFSVKTIRQDVGSWSFWRESWRFQAKETRKGLVKDPWWLAGMSKFAETVSCSLGRGSVIVVYAQKGTSERARNQE